MKSLVRLSGASQGHGAWWLEGQGPWNFQEHVLPHSQLACVQATPSQ